jgi:tRNA(fMet)-specific endonuclease VapC
MLKYMLDTNIVMHVIKRRPLEALETFNRHTGQLCISAITLAELFYSADKSGKPEHNFRQIEEFISRLEVLDYSTKAAAHYGNIRANLERKGTPIGVNDLHIAGHARSEGLILVTNKLREFERVESLRLENWLGS